MLVPLHKGSNDIKKCSDKFSYKIEILWKSQHLYLQSSYHN
jgi:hypothetical protein